MRTAERLAELCAIRDRELTEEEQREAIRCASREQDNRRKHERYWTDQAYRRETIARSVANARKRGWK